jgi:hypothetical protein
METKRAMYVLQLLRFLGHDIACPIGYLIDCSAVEELSKKLGATKRTEHFLRLRMLRRMVLKLSKS